MAEKRFWVYYRYYRGPGSTLWNIKKFYKKEEAENFQREQEEKGLETQMQEK